MRVFKGRGHHRPTLGKFITPGILFLYIANWIG
jgi:hypothetical protein